MGEDQLYHDPDLAQFYDLDNGWGADLTYCAHLADSAASVLDLGCGTGRFAAALATEPERRIVGVDPAAAMLAIASGRPGGERVRWVEADARSVRLGETFDLVVLTGHAFQVFLTDDDRLAALRTIAAHLSASGRFIFDTRNPLQEAWRGWTPDASRWTLEHERFGRVDAWNDVTHAPETGIVTYSTFYRIAAIGTVHSAQSAIAFVGQQRLADLIAEAGLSVDTWLGDWNGAPFAPGTPEIIPLGRRA